MAEFMRENGQWLGPNGPWSGSRMAPEVVWEGSPGNELSSIVRIAWGTFVLRVWPNDFDPKWGWRVFQAYVPSPNEIPTGTGVESDVQAAKRAALTWLGEYVSPDFAALLSLLRLRDAGEGLAEAARRVEGNDHGCHAGCSADYACIDRRCYRELGRALAAYDKAVGHTKRRETEKAGETG